MPLRSKKASYFTPVQVDEAESQFADPYGSALQEGLQSRYKVYFGSAVEQFLKMEYQKVDCSAEACSQNVAIQFNTSLVADADYDAHPNNPLRHPSP